jgi:hypothetical protein
MAQSSQDCYAVTVVVPKNTVITSGTSGAGCKSSQHNRSSKIIALPRHYSPASRQQPADSPTPCLSPLPGAVARSPSPSPSPPSRGSPPGSSASASS